MSGDSIGTKSPLSSIGGKLNRPAGTPPFAYTSGLEKLHHIFSSQALPPLGTGYRAVRILKYTSILNASQHLENPFEFCPPRQEVTLRYPNPSPFALSISKYESKRICLGIDTLKQNRSPLEPLNMMSLSRLTGVEGVLDAEIHMCTSLRS